MNISYKGKTFTFKENSAYGGYFNFFVNEGGYRALPRFLSDPDSFVNQDDRETEVFNKQLLLNSAVAVAQETISRTPIVFRPAIKSLKVRDKTFKSEKKFWTEENTIHFEASNGLEGKVYMRNDVFDPDFIGLDGRSNLKRMSDGDSPVVRVGNEDIPVDLHHMIQHRNGPFAEVDGTFHKKYHGILHIWRGGKGGKKPSEFQFSRSEFNKFRKEYWEFRATKIKNDRTNNNNGG
ncbi:HNH/ENDO VII family nuclease [Aquimarina sp. AU58]|uniref:HNH/ENDO VII family nuclease n=1 Tax=Aquimarina sp. AU58 TaxID=1874112 RepID=UPI003519E404